MVFSFTAGEKISPLGNYEDSLKLNSGILPLLFDLFENSLAQAFAAVDRGEDSVVALRRQAIGVQRAFDLCVGRLLDLFFARRVLLLFTANESFDSRRKL